MSSLAAFGGCLRPLKSSLQSNFDFLIFVEFWLKFQCIEQQTTFAVCFQIELIDRVGILTYLMSLSQDYRCEQQVADFGPWELPKLSRHWRSSTRASNWILFDEKRLPMICGVLWPGRLDLANKMRCDKIDICEFGEKNKLCGYLLTKNVKNGYIPYAMVWKVIS